jgi:carbon-monoxide dehydrogenase medium subunit
MYPSKFNYVKVHSFSEATAALMAAGAGGKLLAGGQTLIPMMKLRLLKPTLLVDLGGIDSARDIVVGQEAVEIGALAFHAQIGSDPALKPFPIIADCALGIADAQIRHMGTIGGSLAEADPSSCWPALLSTVDARVMLKGPDGERIIKVRDLLADAYTPSLEEGEIITRVLIDREALKGSGTFVAFKRAAQAYPTASCALQITFDGDRVQSLRLGFGCLGLTPRVFLEAADMAFGRALSHAMIEDIAQAASQFVEPIEDNKGSEAYKRSLARGLAKRAFEIVTARFSGAPGPETHTYYG